MQFYTDPPYFQVKMQPDKYCPLPRATQYTPTSSRKCYLLFTFSPAVKCNVILPRHGLAETKRRDPKRQGIENQDIPPPLPMFLWKGPTKICPSLPPFLEEVSAKNGRIDHGGCRRYGAVGPCGCCLMVESLEVITATGGDMRRWAISGYGSSAAIFRRRNSRRRAVIRGSWVEGIQLPGQSLVFKVLAWEGNL